MAGNLAILAFSGAFPLSPWEGKQSHQSSLLFWNCFLSSLPRFQRKSVNKKHYRKRARLKQNETFCVFFKFTSHRRLLSAWVCRILLKNWDVGFLIHTCFPWLAIQILEMALFSANVRTALKRAIPLSVICSRSRTMCFSPAEPRAISPNLEFSPDCDEAMTKRLGVDMQIHKDFINAEEEKNLLEELELKFKRSRYQYDHWDDVTWNFIINVDCPTVKWPPFVILDLKGYPWIQGNRETYLERSQQ